MERRRKIDFELPEIVSELGEAGVMIHRLNQATEEGLKYEPTVSFAGYQIVSFKLKEIFERLHYIAFDCAFGEEGGLKEA